MLMTPKYARPKTAPSSAYAPCTAVARMKVAAVAYSSLVLGGLYTLGRTVFGRACGACAALAYVGLANLDRVAIVSANDEISARMEPTRSKKRIFRVFRFLNEVEADGGTDLGTALRTFVAQHKRRGLAVLLSDLYDPAGFEKGINVLRYNRFEPFAISVCCSSSCRSSSCCSSASVCSTVAPPKSSTLIPLLIIAAPSDSTCSRALVSVS